MDISKYGVLVYPLGRLLNTSQGRGDRLMFGEVPSKGTPKSIARYFVGRREMEGSPAGLYFFQDGERREINFLNKSRKYCCQIFYNNDSDKIQVITILSKLGFGKAWRDEGNLIRIGGIHELIVDIISSSINDTKWKEEVYLDFEQEACIQVRKNFRYYLTDALHSQLIDLILQLTQQGSYPVDLLNPPTDRRGISSLGSRLQVHVKFDMHSLCDMVPGTYDSGDTLYETLSLNIAPHAILGVGVVPAQVLDPNQGHNGGHGEGYSPSYKPNPMFLEFRLRQENTVPVYASTIVSTLFEDAVSSTQEPIKDPEVLKEITSQCLRNMTSSYLNSGVGKDRRPEGGMYGYKKDSCTYSTSNPNPNFNPNPNSSSEESQTQGKDREKEEDDKKEDHKGIEEQRVKIEIDSDSFKPNKRYVEL